MCSVVRTYGSTSLRFDPREIVSVLCCPDAREGRCASLRCFAAAVLLGGLLRAIVGDDDMPEDDGAFVAGAIGAGGGFMFGVVEEGRTAIVVVILGEHSAL